MKILPKIILIGALSVACHFLNAQQKDSLFKVVRNKSLTLLERYKAISVIEKRYLNKNPDTCLLLSELLAKEFPQADSTQASSLILKGTANYYKAQYDSSIKYLKAAYEVEKRVKRREKLSGIFNNLSNAYERLGNYDSSLVYGLKSLDLFEVRENEELNKAMALYAVGNTYRKLFDYAKAKGYFEKALAISVKLDDLRGQSACNSNLGNVYNGLKDYKKALECFDIALKINISTGDSLSLGSVLNNIGITYSYLNDFAKAKDYYTRAYRVRKKIGDINGLAYSTLSLAQVQMALKNYAQCIAYANEALDIFKRIGVKDGILRCYKALELAAKNSGKMTEAYDYLNLYTNLKDSLLAIEKVKQANALEAKFQNEKNTLEIGKLNSEKALQENQIAKQKAESEKQLFFIFLVATLGLAALVIAIVVFRSLRLARKQKNIIELQKEIVTQQKHIVEEKQKEVLDSIYYARRIQRALITNEKYIEKRLRRLNP